MTGNKDTNCIQEFNHKISTTLGVPYFIHSKKKGKRQQMETETDRKIIFSHILGRM